MERSRGLPPVVLAAALLAGHAAALLPQTAAAQAQGTELAAVPLHSADLEFMLQASQTNLAALRAADLALTRSENAHVQALARRMVDNHAEAQRRLLQIARDKGVALTREPSRQQSYVLDALRGLDGQHFDRSFVQRIGIEAHQEAFNRHHAQAAASGRNAELARYAQAMLPRLQDALVLAQDLQPRVGVAPSWNAAEIAAADAGPALQLVENAVQSLDRMQDAPQAAQMLRRAQGVFVLPDYGRAALGLGVQGGRGVLVTRQDGGFSNPVFYDLSGLSLGAQAGASAGDIVFLLMTERAVQQFRSERNFSLNLDLAGALGPASARAQASTGKIQDVVVWSGTRGIFAGLSVGVVNVNVSEDLNRRYYGREDATPLAILGGRVRNPHQPVLAQVLEG